MSVSAERKTKEYLFFLVSFPQRKAKENTSGYAKHSQGPGF